MIVDSVEMLNWRAYERRIFRFEPGITFLMGLNGCGKTSILEAINYALTGDPATVTDRKKMLRDPEKVATVRLQFSVNGERYEIERSQSARRAESAKLVRRLTDERDKVLASSHRGVTAHVEKILGISCDFLERIIYMSEGDVFRFLSKPPGEALDLQIRQVLGLTQLDQFLQALKTAQKEILNQIDELRSLLEELDAASAARKQDFESWQQQAAKQQQERLADLRFVENKISRHQQEHDALLRLKPLLEQVLPTLRRDEKTVARIDAVPVLTLFEELETRLSQLQLAEREADETLARWQSEDTASNEILGLVAPLMDHDKTVPCPVCQKPFTHLEREAVLGEIRGVLNRLTEEREAVKERRTRLRAELSQVQAQVDALRPLVNILAHAAPETVSETDSLLQIQKMISAQEEVYQRELAGLEESVNLLSQEIERLQQESAELLAVRRRLQNMGYDTPALANEGMVALETRLLSLRAAEEVAQAVLTERRNVDMDAIYEQIARVWTAFAGRGEWQIQMDRDGLPVLRDDAQRQFDLSQFSGGEKTGLLVILHTIIAQYFSETDFLLVDEPLEHLDPVNRRSLIQFLVNAYRRGRFRQAIIATFEESLIRKYMTDDAVQVIHL